MPISSSVFTALIELALGLSATGAVVLLILLIVDLRGRAAW